MVKQEFPRPDLRPYLGQTVTIEIDRPMGYIHRKGEKTLRDNQDTVDDLKRKAKDLGDKVKASMEKAKPEYN